MWRAISRQATDQTYARLCSAPAAQGASSGRRADNAPSVHSPHLTTPPSRARKTPCVEAKHSDHFLLCATSAGKSLNERNGAAGGSGYQHNLPERVAAFELAICLLDIREAVDLSDRDLETARLDQLGQACE